MRRLPFIMAILSLVAACDPAWEERSTQMRWDPAGDFWSLPIPSDMRIQKDGTWDLEKWPGDWTASMVAMWLAAGEEALDGKWGLSSGAFVHSSGVIDATSLPQSPEASRLAGSSVFLVDIDPSSPDRGKRFPLETSFDTEGDLYAPTNLLAALPVPGFIRRPNTRYALVVTDAVKDIDGASVGRSKAFHEAFEDIEGEDLARQNFKDLREQLELDGVDSDKVIAASVFTTADPSALTQRLANWAETQPLPEMSQAWTRRETQYEGASYILYTARLAMPRIQLGNPPFARADEGRIAWDANGNPDIQRYQDMRVVLALPKSEQPAAGFPLTIYAHGSGGEWMQVINRGPQEERDDAPVAEPGTGPAEWMARRGVAALGFDFPLHGNRNSPPDTTGLMLYNLTGNAAGSIANFNAAVMELTLLSRLMLETLVPSNIADGLDLGGQSGAHFDPERLSGMGQSMGSTIGVNWASVDPRLKAFVLSGSGGLMAEIATAAVEPFDVAGVLQAVLQPGRRMQRNHPLIHAMQNVWDMVDPVIKAQRLVADPLPGVPTKHILMPAGVLDGYFSPRAEAALAVHLKAPLVGEEVEPFLPWALRLDGREATTYPVKNNLNGRTAAVIQYAADNTKGHYVLFNQEGARFQYTCFLASIGTPEGARISAPAPLDSACP
jgi:hypothetical protein